MPPATPSAAASVAMVVLGVMGLNKMVCSSIVVLISVRWTGTPGVRMEPSLLMHECVGADGSKKRAAWARDVARISWEVRMLISIILIGWLVE